MHGGKAGLPNKGQCLLKLPLCLSGETGDKIGGNGRIVKIPAQKRAGLQIPRRVVLAVHPLQRGVTAALEGEVEVGAQIGELRGPGTEVLGDGAGFQAAQPDAQRGYGGAERLQQVDEALTVFQILAPAGDLDTGDHDLPIALSGHALCFRHRLVQRQRAHRPSGVGNGAIGAEIDTAILYLEHTAGTPFQSAGGQELKLPTTHDRIHIDALLSMDSLLQIIQELHPIPGSVNQVHIQFLQLFRGGLSVTAADGHHSVRASAPGPADHLAGLFIADRRDRAGIDDIGIRRLLKLHQLMPPLTQNGLHGLRLVLIHFTSQRINGNFHSTSSYIQSLFIISAFSPLSKYLHRQKLLCFTSALGRIRLLFMIAIQERKL